MRWRGNIAVTAYLKQRFYITVFKKRIAAAEDEVNGARYIAVSEDLALELTGAELVLKKAVISLDEIGRERAAEDGVLSGYKAAVFGEELVGIDGESYLLTLGLGRERVVFNGEISQSHTRREDRHCIGAECYIFKSVFVDFLGVIVIDDDGILRAFANKLYVGDAYLDFLAVGSFGKNDAGVRGGCFEDLRKLVLGRYAYLGHFGDSFLIKFSDLCHILIIYVFDVFFNIYCKSSLKLHNIMCWRERKLLIFIPKNLSEIFRDVRIVHKIAEKELVHFRFFNIK